MQKMNWSVIITVFTAVFIAELGDKTQLATMLFSADKEINKWEVFLASAVALVLSSAIGVLVGGLFSRYISEKLIQVVSGVIFFVIGIYTLYRAFT